MLIHDAAGASLCYDMTISCSEIDVHNITARDSGELALALGCVTDDTDLACLCPDAEPGALPFIWTNTGMRSNVSAASVGETVTYTITFVNYSPYALESVRISADVPAGVAVVYGSVRPAPKPGETLQTGISMGSVAPRQSLELVYSVIINSHASGEVVNRACAEYCCMDCRGCCRRGTGSCQNSVVKILPGDICVSINKSADKKSICSVDEEITYTLVVSNTGNVALTDVILVDNIPQGLCYKESSTSRNGGPPVHENPQDGIVLGILSPEQSYTVTFVLTVCMRQGCANSPAEFVNTATLTGLAGEITVSVKSNPVVLTMDSKCLWQCVQQRFHLCDFCCLRYAYLSYTGVTCHDTKFGRMVSAGFGIAVKYLDCCGNPKSKFYKGNVIFCGLSEDFDPAHFTVRFSEMECCIDCCGNITACFGVRLCYCRV